MASTQSPEERAEKEYHRIERTATGLYVLAPIAVGFVAGLISSFGRDVSPEFFSVVAEGLLPVFLITAVLQYSLVARRQLELDSSRLSEQDIGRTLVAAFGLFVVGEGTALYAVASESSSTFLVVTPLVAGLTFLGDILLATRHQFGSGIEKYLPSRRIQWSAERQSQMELAMAQRLEDRARELRDRRRQPVEGEWSEGE